VTHGAAARSRAALLGACGLIAGASLAIAASAAGYAHATAARGPDRAEVAQAAQAAIAQRWERLSLGQIFPATVGYTSPEATSETATRLGISADDSCAAALDDAVAPAAGRLGCVAALRASYADELGGTVYTVGVVVFPGVAAARGFAAVVPRGGHPAAGLNTLPLPGTAAALFTDQARQAATVQVTGPYVVVAVSGYADGRPATATASGPPAAVFGPAARLVASVVAPFAAPQPVTCADPEFTC
jgi:hypothetical protein